MNDLQMFERMFDYDAWGTKKVFRKVMNNEFEERDDAVQMIAHILRASKTWHERIAQSDPPVIDLWPKDPYSDELKPKIHRRKEDWLNLIQSPETSVDMIITYTNSSGEEFSNSLRELLHHVIIHGQHHRAQITKMLRRGDVEPPQTDFIFYTRSDEYRVGTE